MKTGLPCESSKFTSRPCFHSSKDSPVKGREPWRTICSYEKQSNAQVTSLDIFVADRFGNHTFDLFFENAPVWTPRSQGGNSELLDLGSVIPVGKGGLRDSCIGCDMGNRIIYRTIYQYIPQSPPLGSGVRLSGRRISRVWTLRKVT
jgi:hypothetical protein